MVTGSGGECKTACDTEPSNAPGSQDFDASSRVTEPWAHRDFLKAVRGTDRTITRCYSLSDCPRPTGYRVTIMRVPLPAGQPELPPGVSSSHFHDRVPNASCVTCHTGNDFSRYTCYGGHEHTLANVRRKHQEEGIQNFENCAECHRSASGEPERKGKGEGRKRD